MAKRKRSAPTDPAPVEQPAPAEDPFAAQVFTSSGNLALHDLFQQQAMRMLENSDLTEEQKQEALVTMSCPCCGMGAMSYTVKLRR